MSIIRNFLRKINYVFLINKGAKVNAFENKFRNQSFSQEGEDMVLLRLFEGQNDGFFVDVGAHHPYRFSNTNLFYKKGWRGINIDPLPNSKELFDKYRPEDTNLCVAVSALETDMTYFMFNEPALNTFSEIEASGRDGIHDGKFNIVEKRLIRTKKLSTILNENISFKKNIDFFSIDVEGMDLEVLKSNDWEKYRPKVILVEELSISISEILRESKVYLFLKEKNYDLIYKTNNTSFYVNLDLI